MTNVFWDTFLHTVNISWSSSTSQCSNVQSHLFAESSAICRKQGHMQKDAKWVESDLNAVLKTWSFSVFRRIRGDLIILMVCLRFKILKLKKKKKAPNVLWKADTCFIAVYSELFFLFAWKIKHSPNTEFISYFLKDGEACIYGKSTESRHDRSRQGQEQIHFTIHFKISFWIIWM